MGLFQTSGTTADKADAAPGNGAAPKLPPHLQKALARLTEISSLPEITTRIVEIVEDPRSTADDMHELVKHDPALAAKILKVVNSAFYGLPAQIASLDRAIIMLGLSAVKNIALAASLSRLFRPGAVSEQFAARDLWSHCVGVGVCARMLAESGQAQPEEAFVAGLVHDMGLLVEYQLFPDKLKAVADECGHSSEPFCTVEGRVIGADHQVFGATIAAKWKFPPGLRHAIAYHHNPTLLNPEFQPLATTIYLADTICCQNHLGFWLTAKRQTATEDMLAAIGVNSERVQQVLEELPERVKETERIFSD
jgi:putative nucleotidyltransferase with HDIG domain